jgi:hypothetical protein
MPDFRAPETDTRTRGFRHLLNGFVATWGLAVVQDKNSRVLPAH